MTELAVCRVFLSTALLAAMTCAQQGPDPSGSLERARGLVTAGRPEAAIPLYQDLTRANPDNPSLLVGLAIAQFKAARYQDAAVSSIAALELSPGLFPGLLFLGASRVELGDSTGAVGPLEQAIAARPEDLNARLYLANALAGAGRPADALPHFQAVVARAPLVPAAWYGLGLACDDLAETSFRKASLASPGSAVDLALTGDFQVRRGQFAQAFRTYRQALALDPALPGIHEAVAAIYEKTGHTDWAAAERQKPATPPVRSYAALEEARHYAEMARGAYAKLEELPPFTQQHEAAARRFESRGQYREAAAEWKAALGLAPGSLRVRAALGSALLNSHDLAAQEHLRVVLDQNPDSAEVNFLYGASLLESQQAERAVPYLERAVKSDPNLAATHATLGQALLQTGKPEAAIPHLEAGAADDRDGTRHYQLARALKSAGRSADAAKALTRSAELRQQFEAEAREPAITPP